VSERLEALKAQANASPQTIDYYVVLGLTRDASEKDIRSAFKRLCLVHHPDKSTVVERSGAEMVFRLLTAAKRVLTCPETRKALDDKLQSRS